MFKFVEIERPRTAGADQAADSETSLRAVQMQRSELHSPRADMVSACEALMQLSSSDSEELQNFRDYIDAQIRLSGDETPETFAALKEELVNGLKDHGLLGKVRAEMEAKAAAELDSRDLKDNLILGTVQEQRSDLFEHILKPLEDVVTQLASAREHVMGTDEDVFIPNESVD